MPPTPCRHPQEARETILIPNDERNARPPYAIGEPITLAGVRYCTICYTMIVHLGEDVHSVDVSVDDLT